jgi:peroxiredoxin
MAIAVGDKVPDVAVQILRDGKPETLQTGEILGRGKVVLFAVPGAFTPGCSKLHLPGYVQRGDELRAKGVDTIACISVNDAWVMDAWGEAQGANDKNILMLGDGNGAFADAMGLVFDGSGVGLGTRSQRYAAVIEDGTITDLEVEPAPGVDVSSCDNILTKV